MACPRFRMCRHWVNSILQLSNSHKQASQLNPTCHSPGKRRLWPLRICSTTGGQRGYTRFSLQITSGGASSINLPASPPSAVRRGATPHSVSWSGSTNQLVPCVLSIEEDGPKATYPLRNLVKRGFIYSSGDRGQGGLFFDLARPSASLHLQKYPHFAVTAEFSKSEISNFITTRASESMKKRNRKKRYEIWK